MHVILNKTFTWEQSARNQHFDRAREFHPVKSHLKHLRIREGSVENIQVILWLCRWFYTSRRMVVLQWIEWESCDASENHWSHKELAPKDVARTHNLVTIHEYATIVNQLIEAIYNVDKCTIRNTGSPQKTYHYDMSGIQRIKFLGILRTSWSNQFS